ncbi:alpha/beta fold hydrolase [Ruminiclostridium herbifermentans]|uniref:alpha/beta fold hydrolase n=1 Tax=Ruminiclostridium herbifermentans TaxID=2488810 RepID=UPI001FD48E99|nr:alpha/beta fold hydrolase [Ruminiclostridium herbifermentans]
MHNKKYMAADIVGLMDALGFDSVHLVGASMGGMISQTVAIEYPERVRSQRIRRNSENCSFNYR